MEIIDKAIFGFCFLIILILIIRIKKRNYFWKDKAGNKLTFKQFTKRWKDGVINITPVQQTKTTLWSFIPIFAGLTWGIVMTFIGGTYWLTLILVGSFPITTIQFISNIQKYKAQKRAQDAFNEAMNIKPKKLKKKKKKRRKKYYIK